jgi:hypothetical protein
MHEGNSGFNKFKIFFKNIKGVVFTVVLLGAVIVLFITAVGGASEKADTSAVAALDRAIRRAAVQCFAIEGFYPIELDYLVENYGLVIDETRFVIYYRAEMPNFMPDVQVRRFGVYEEE